MKFRLLSSKREVQIVPIFFGLVKKRVAKWPISVILLSCLYIYISGTKPQGLFNSASFSHRRPHFNSDRQILRYSVLLGIHYKFNDDWWITSVPAMGFRSGGSS